MKMSMAFKVAPVAYSIPIRRNAFALFTFQHLSSDFDLFISPFLAKNMYVLANIGICLTMKTHWTSIQFILCSAVISRNCVEKFIGKLEKSLYLSSVWSWIKCGIYILAMMPLQNALWNSLFRRDCPIMCKYPYGEWQMWFRSKLKITNWTFPHGLRRRNEICISTASK